MSDGDSSKKEIKSPMLRPRKSPWPCVPVNDALHIVDEFFKPGPHCTLPLRSIKHGCVLAERIVATKPLPELPTSIMDGYAVIASDGPGLRDVVNEACPRKPLKAHAAFRVNTGSIVPAGADAVVQIENTRLVKHDNGKEEVVEILSDPKVGQNIRQIGSDVAVGEVLLHENTVLGSAEEGILHGSRQKYATVFEKPKVAVMSTGNEIVDASSESCPLGSVIDTNRPQLIALFESVGCHVSDCGIVIDDVNKLKMAFEEAFELADIIVTSGGVSMGEMDYVKGLLRDELGFTIHFGRVWMKPGLPTTFATGKWNGIWKAVFSLPGNPVSSWVTAHLFVVPALRKVAGWSNYNFSTVFVQMRDKIVLDVRPEYRRARLVLTGCPTLEATCVDKNQISSRLLSTRGANLLLKLPGRTTERPVVDVGDIIEAIIIGSV